MRSYFIFAIVLTVAYLIYYAVIIMQDLYGKRRTGKTEEEVFDLGTLEDEESVAVSESETGFRVGNEQYDTETASGGDSATDQKPADKKPETKETPEERLERLKAKAEEKMEETTPYLSDGFSADEMYKAMLSRGKLENRPEMAWKPIKDIELQQIPHQRIIIINRPDADLAIHILIPYKCTAVLIGTSSRDGIIFGVNIAVFAQIRAISLRCALHRAAFNDSVSLSVRRMSIPV